ncbi:hypothetical protein ABZ835_47760 [Streptomyces sp. NPDC047461]|uniref:hypothetical protein n=1 Tax=Streptomyces sp. NPDC047461 TaxID=3155619 RepID=UPI0033E3797B
MNVHLRPELVDKAKAIAHERGMMLSGYIRTLIERDLEGKEAAAKAFAEALEAGRH